MTTPATKNIALSVLTGWECPACGDFTVACPACGAPVKVPRAAWVLADNSGDTDIRVTCGFIGQHSVTVHHPGGVIPAEYAATHPEFPNIDTRFEGFPL